MSSSPRPFPFGVQEHSAGSAREWMETARAVESLGHKTLYLPDHFGHQLGPIAALMAAADDERSGIPYDSPVVRIERMEEGLAIIKGLLAGGAFSFSGKHYRITSLEGHPSPVQKPHPPILLGGGGRRMLSLAAREADIVNVNFDLREGRVSRRTARSGFADVTVEKLAWIKEAAGERFEHLELGAWIFMANVTEGREDVAA